MPTTADPAAVAARMRPARQQHRVTRLSLHPADVVASHAADGIATALSSGFESAVMRTVARSFLIRQAGVDISTVESTVYRPSEIRGNLRLVTKALAGEWALMWMLFEGSYYASTFIGLRWFGLVRSLPSLHILSLVSSPFGGILLIPPFAGTQEAFKYPVFAYAAVLLATCYFGRKTHGMLIKGIVDF